MISIIITAYKAQDFIEECLDSVMSQTCQKFETLLGIDGCKETLEKVLKIKNKYKNIRVFMMKKNYGTYIVSNTLLDNASHDKILRFDSDDIMKKRMIETLIKHDADIIRMKYITFGRSQKKPNRYSWGQALFKKKVFDACGGYEPWRCAADKDLISRASQIFKVKTIEDRLFFKRMHKKALTKAKITGKNSNIRNEAHKNIKHNINNKIVKIKRITGEFEIIQDNNSLSLVGEA